MAAGEGRRDQAAAEEEAAAGAPDLAMGMPDPAPEAPLPTPSRPTKPGAGVRYGRKEQRKGGKRVAGEHPLPRPLRAAAAAVRRLAAAAAGELDVGRSVGRRRVAPPVACGRRGGVTLLDFQL
jgi:hypothetical protein